MKIVLALFFSVYAAELWADSWMDFFLTPDQKGYQRMKESRYADAQAAFERQDWQAAASYRLKDYAHAAEAFSALQTDEGYYNQGNALAQSGQFQEAIKAYDKALALNSKHQDALDNRKILSDLLRDQKSKEPAAEQKSQKKSSEKKEDHSDKKQSESQDPKNPGSDDAAEKSDSSSAASMAKDQQKPQAPQVNPVQDVENASSKKSDEQAFAPADDRKDAEQKPKPEAKEKSALNQAQGASDSKTLEKSTDAKDASPQASEEHLEKERWLRLIPDDPAGLIREKLMRDYLRKQGG